LIKDQTPAVDGNGYPLGYFEAMADDAEIWRDFPTAEELRANEVPDLPREEW
jgi:hypothetical protein